MNQPITVISFCKIVVRSVVYAALVILVQSVQAQTLSAPFSGDYNFRDLGAVSGVLTPYGGLTINPNNVNQLLIGGSADNTGGVIYSVTVTRDSSGRIIGFVNGSLVQRSTASSIDGGLQFAPNGVLVYTTYSGNLLGQIKPGSSTPDKTTSLTGLGVQSSTGSLAFVPAGFANAGHLKVTSFSGSRFYDMTISPDGNGTYNISAASSTVALSGGSEGIAFVRGGNRDFATNSVIVSEWSSGNVTAFQLDGNSNPTGIGRNFISGLTGALGETFDPVTGDLLISTYGGLNHVYEVEGFVPTPEPSSLALLVIGALSLAAWRLIARSRASPLAL